MWQEKYIVVGDLFSSFAEGHASVLTRSQFFMQLTQSPVTSEQVSLLLGQGVDKTDIEKIIRLTSNPLDAFTLVDHSDQPKAVMQHTHKHRMHNVVVSRARRISDDEFELDLMLDSANELLADHMSGAHVQGMVLVEAARQAFLSITEQFYSAALEMDFYFVINSMDIEYKSFLFPVGSRLNYRILEQKIRKDRMSFEVAIEIHQAGKLCAQSRIGFTAFEASAIARKEQRDALATVDRLLQKSGAYGTLTTAA